MPRVKPLGAKKDFEKVGRLIRGYANITQLSNVLSCSYNTANKRLENPEELRLKDIKVICQRLHIPIEEMRESIRI